MSTTLLKEILPKKIKKTNLSVASIERMAGLKRGAINNILLGRSKNPSLKTIKAIADVLNCRVEDLIDAEVAHKVTPAFRVKDNSSLNIEYYDLFNETSSYAISYIKSRNLKPSAEAFLQAIIQIYDYSISKEECSFDKHFAEWMLSTHL